MKSYSYNNKWCDIKIKCVHQFPYDICSTRFSGTKVQTLDQTSCWETRLKASLNWKIASAQVATSVFHLFHVPRHKYNKILGSWSNTAIQSYTVTLLTYDSVRFCQPIPTVVVLLPLDSLRERTLFFSGKLKSWKLYEILTWRNYDSCKSK